MVSLRAQFFSRVMRTSCRFPPGQAQSDSRARLGSSAAAYPQPALRKQGGHLVDLEYLDNILAGSHRTHIHGTKPRFLDFTLDGGGRLFRRARHQRPDVISGRKYHLYPLLPPPCRHSLSIPACGMLFLPHRQRRWASSMPSSFFCTVRERIIRIFSRPTARRRTESWNRRIGIAQLIRL